MASPSLTDLPTELQSAIVSWIHRPAHLANVCRTSKQLRDVAMPIMYQSIQIHSSPRSKWRQGVVDGVHPFFRHGHTGLKHIKSLEIYTDIPDNQPGAVELAKRALSFLPYHGLKAFKLPSYLHGMDNGLMILLAAKQRNLETLWIGPLESTAMDIIECLRPWPSIIRTLEVPRFFGPQDFDFYQQLIERSGSYLKALTVRTNGIGNTHFMNRDRYASTSFSRELVGYLFRNNLQLQSRAALQDLCIADQNLLCATNIWLRAVDFSKLRSLRMWHCLNPDVLLKSLIQRNELPLKLKGLVLAMYVAMEEPGVVTELLSSFSGLQYLQLSFPWTADDEETPNFDLRCLDRHKDSIKDLYIGIGTNKSGDTVLTSLTIQQIEWLTGFPKLWQLGVPLPSVRLSHAFAGRWDRFGEALELLARLPRLKVLRVLTVSLPSHENQGPERTYVLTPGSRYLEQLSIFALCIARAFSYLRTELDDRLSVVAFGVGSHNYMEMGNGSRLATRGLPITYKVRRNESEFGFLTEIEYMSVEDIDYEEPIGQVKKRDSDRGLCLKHYPWGDCWSRAIERSQATEVIQE